MRTKVIIAAGVAAAAVATAVAVPALAASSDSGTPAPARVATGERGFVLDPAALRKRLDAKIDEAVAGGWITPKLAAVLKAQLAAGERMAPSTRGLEARLLARVASALGTTPKELRAELRSGKTLGQILQAHGKSPDALVQKLVDRLDQQLGQAVGKGKLSEQRPDTLIQRLQARLGAWLARLLAQGS